MNALRRWNIAFCIFSAFAVVSCAASPCPSTSIALHQWTLEEEKRAGDETQALETLSSKDAGSYDRQIAVGTLSHDDILISVLKDYARLRREVQ